MTTDIDRDLGHTPPSRHLDLCTYAGVAVRNTNNEVIGTLGGTSRRPISIDVTKRQRGMESFATVIGQSVS